MIRTQKAVDIVFTRNFGETPLKQRLDDILTQAMSLHRYSYFKDIKEELGDLLASAMQLANECNLNAEKLVNATLDKIDGRAEQYKTLGRKIEVALLGGAFDPPTIGHIEVAKFVLNASGVFDEVWLLPCYKHMYDKNMSSPEDRLAMCRLAAMSDGRIKACDYEIANQMSGETYNLMKRLLSEEFSKNKYNFSFIIGMDNANTFSKWANYRDIERLARFVVVPRKGVEPVSSDAWYLKFPHIYLDGKDSPVPEISSSLVRNAIANNQFSRAASLVDSQVWEYICKNNLYGA
ncbi:MAG: nicotinate (nicotinamide) nucleotide adenylyltransferase [Phenylobacterium sp.]